MIVDNLYISTSIFEVIQPLLITCRFFGLFPISYKKNGNNYRLKWSISYAIYSYSLTIALVLWTIIGMIIDMRNKPKESFRMIDAKTKFVTGGDISIVVVIVIYETMTLHRRVDKFWKLMTVLNKADTIIPLKTSKKLRKSSILFITLVIMTIFFIQFFDIATWFVSLKQRKLQSLLYLKYYGGFYILYSVIILLEVFFWHVIFLIKIRISLLNKDLTKIKDKFKLKQDTYFLENFVGAVYIEKFFGSTRGQLPRNTNTTTSTVNFKNDETTEIWKKLLSLSTFHDKIFEAVTIVNNSGEFCIHVLMLSCLLHLIVTPYFLLKGFITNGPSYYVLLQSTWLLGHIGRVLIIVEPCQYCIDEHIKTASIICELLTFELDEELKKAITILSLQLSYCKMRFTSCGFFKINRSLLTSVAGAVTTYLVILFQFNDT